MPIDTATPMNTAPRREPRAVTLPLVCGLGMAAIALTFTTFNSETAVTTGFERAFAALQKPTVKVATRAYDGIAGTEEFWLRSNANAHLVKAVAVGQEITLASNGTERRLTITSVADADEAITHIQTAASRALLVTCREGDASTGHEIRFRLDANQITELPATPIATQRAL
jgi:hypothetical protein